jgi:hypothetical protein
MMGLSRVRRGVAVRRDCAARRAVKCREVLPAKGCTSPSRLATTVGSGMVTTASPPALVLGLMLPVEFEDNATDPNSSLPWRASAHATHPAGSGDEQRWCVT